MFYIQMWTVHNLYCQRFLALRYKDGTELTSETNKELSLTSLGSDDQGRYQCSAKLTADPNLPAVRSEEAMLTIRGIVNEDVYL